jgi:hypothetical protein
MHDSQLITIEIPAALSSLCFLFKALSLNASFSVERWVLEHKINYFKTSA